MKLIVGLGNPGTKYQLNRHNIGFLTIDALGDRHHSASFRNEHKAQVSKLNLHGTPVLLAKPQTYMNLSGESVQSLMHFYNVALEDLLVVQDDIDQPFKVVRFQSGRGHGGHNGIRSIHQMLASDAYARLKLGVGRPIHPGMDVADYVLQNFSDTEEPALVDVIALACDAVEYFIGHGVQKAANKFNAMKLE